MPVLYAAYIFAVYITIKSSRDVIENGSAAFGIKALISGVSETDRMRIMNGGSSTFTVFVVSAVVRFTVDIDGFASTAGVHCVLCRTFILASETFTGCIISVAGFCTLYADGTFGTERIFVVTAVMGRTF